MTDNPLEDPIPHANSASVNAPIFSGRRMAARTAATASSGSAPAN